MKMTKRKNFFSLLAVLLLIFSVSGCGNQDKVGKDSLRQTASSVDETIAEISGIGTDAGESNVETDASECNAKTSVDESSVDTDKSGVDIDADESNEETANGGLGQNAEPQKVQQAGSFNLENIPGYSGKAYTEVNGNVPFFTDSELTATSYESYSELDHMGRCGACIASVGQDIMPTEKRGTISSVKPTGWHTIRYDGVVDGGSLYNRSHLIGYQLTAENANEKNLITGTRYMNVDGMLPFENMVADYVKETDNHVLYRVTPVFEEDNLLAGGVLMEAESVEDKGEGILFCVYCYNVQPGVAINYKDGRSKLDGTVTPAQNTESSDKQDLQKKEPLPEKNNALSSKQGSYAVNSNNGKIHKNGECTATGSGSNAMDNPVYFDTYEDAENYSTQIAPALDKRQCGNCW